MTKISIENFQSIKKIDFEIKGLTVIIGKNNIGKSAVIRAIGAALNNQTGNDFIRKGEKKAKVTIDHNGQKIEWIKSKNSAQYNISGYEEPFTKLGGAVPKPLIDAGFQNIQIGEHKLYPLITSQFDPLFLINKRGSVITEVLANLYQIDTLSTADDLCQKVIKSNKSLLKTRESDLKEVQLKLEKFKDFTKLKQTVKLLAEKETEIKNLREEIALINGYEIKIEALLKSIARLKTIKDIEIPEKSECEKLISELPWLQERDDRYQKTLLTIKTLKNISKIKIPKKSKCDKLISELPWLQETDDKYNRSLSLIGKLKDTPTINIPEKVEYEETLLEVQWLQEKDDKYCKLVPLIERLKEAPKTKIPTLKKIGTLFKKVTLIRDWDNRINKTKKEMKQQKAILDIYDLDKFTKSMKETAPFFKEFLRVQVIEKEFIEIINSLKSTQTEIKTNDKDYKKLNDKINQFKICPLCGGPLSTCQTS